MANSRSGDSVLDRLVRVLGAFDGTKDSLSIAALPAGRTYRWPRPTAWWPTWSGMACSAATRTARCARGCGCGSGQPFLARGGPAPGGHPVHGRCAVGGPPAHPAGDPSCATTRSWSSSGPSSRGSVVNQAQIAGRMPVAPHLAGHGAATSAQPCPGVLPEPASGRRGVGRSSLLRLPPAPCRDPAARLCPPWTAGWTREHHGHRRSGSSARTATRRRRSASSCRWGSKLSVGGAGADDSGPGDRPHRWAANPRSLLHSMRIAVREAM